MRWTIVLAMVLIIISGCASKEFDQKSYDRQNKAAEKSLDKLEK